MLILPQLLVTTITAFSFGLLIHVQAYGLAAGLGFFGLCLCMIQSVGLLARLINDDK